MLDSFTPSGGVLPVVPDTGHVEQSLQQGLPFLEVGTGEWPPEPPKQK